MMHVGMNIEDKATLFSELFRVLRHGTLFGVYDVMRIGEGELTYPVPWAASSATSAVATPEQYKDALQNAGFTVDAERNRHGFAVDFFEQLRTKTVASKERPPLGFTFLWGILHPLK